MEHKKRAELNKELLPGRIIEKVVGKDSPIASKKMTVGYASYSREAGQMEPHHHAEETVCITAAESGYIRYGTEKDNLGGRIPLQTGDILHFDELEWHVFEYDANGYIEIIFIYGQIENIRPEEITR
jgi:hypothetical protein